MTALNWVIIAIACGAIEVASSGFWFLWLALSAFLVSIGVKIGLLNNLNIQIIVFSCFTLLFLIFTRPLVVRFVKHNDKFSNVNALIGQHGQVLKPISPLEFGQVKLNGEIWTASAAEEIGENTRVVVVAIDGVKLVVEKASEQ